MEKPIYLTFATDRETSEFLKIFAHMAGKTQPQLINEICLDFKASVINYLEEKNNPEPAGEQGRSST